MPDLTGLVITGLVVMLLALLGFGAFALHSSSTLPARNCRASGGHWHALGGCDWRGSR